MSSYQAATSSSLDNTLPNNFSALNRARALVLAHGWNSTSYQIINPGIKRWFAKADDAVVGFVSCNGVRVVAGAPICAKERLPEVLAEFEMDADTNGERVCYFCAEARLESVYNNSPEYSKILLGAQPVWQPQSWSNIVATHKSLAGAVESPAQQRRNRFRMDN